MALAVGLSACASPTPTPTPSAMPSSDPSPVQTEQPTPVETSADGVPTTVFGLPVLSLHEAQQQLLARGSLNGRFAAIEGWFNVVPIPCPAPPHEPELAPACPNIAFSNGALTREDVTVLVPGALRPAIVPETIRSERLSDGENTHVVVIAHTGDARFGQCRPEQRDECLHTLVIDVVAWVDGQVTALPSTDDAGATEVNSYSADATEIWQIDPRFAGLADGKVRLSRLITSPPAEDGAADGFVRLESGTGDERHVLKELPLQLDAGYEPGRITIEPGPGAISFAITLNGRMVAAGPAAWDDPPFSLQPGDYVLSGFDEVAVPTPGDVPGCQIPASLSAFGDLYFKSGSRPSGRCALAVTAP